MASHIQSTPQPHPEQPVGYFDAQASWGVTKHFGGVAVTDELLDACAVGAGTLVLEAGCGVGLTACHAVQSRTCRVVAVDLSPRMLAWAHRRVQRHGLAHAVSLTGADVQQLPLADNSVAAVIGESVLAFVPDPQRALAEYVRVVQPGGFVGITEGTWRKPPPPELEAYLARALGNPHFRSPDAWAAMLQRAGLTLVHAEARRISALAQWRAEWRGRDVADLRDYARAWRVFVRQVATNPAFRRYVRTAWPTSWKVFRVFDSFGYGIFVGRKPPAQA